MRACREGEGPDREDETKMADFVVVGDITNIELVARGHGIRELAGTDGEGQGQAEIRRMHRQLRLRRVARAVCSPWQASRSQGSQIVSG